MEKKKNLSETSTSGLKPLSGKRIGIVTAEWNETVTFAMRDAAHEFLREFTNPEDIIHVQVPGSFELLHASAMLLSKTDGVIAIGCVIQGETPHFTFISQAVANGLAQLNISSGKPVIFGVLTTNNMEQAMDRAGGKHGNKGVEAAATLVKMFNINY